MHYVRVGRPQRLIRACDKARAAVRPPEDGGGSGDIGAQYRAQKREFLGIGLSCLPDEEFVAAVRQAVETRSRLTVSFINPDYVLRGHKMPGLLEKMNR